LIGSRQGSRIRPLTVAVFIRLPVKARVKLLGGILGVLRLGLGVRVLAGVVIRLPVGVTRRHGNLLGRRKALP
jgi:hypothetical protein